MKKMFSIVFIIIVVIITITGCGGYNSKTSENEEDNRQKTIVVGVAQLGKESAWRDANTESIKTAGSKDDEIELIFEDAEGSQEKQIEILKSFINDKVDVIAFAPCIEDGWDEILKRS